MIDKKMFMKVRDPLEVAFDRYRLSLHQADSISEDPSENVPSSLKSKTDYLQDSQTSKEQVQKQLEDDVNTDVLQMATRIRNEQNWVSDGADSLDIEDFDGDFAALLRAKIEKGARFLSQSEKLKLFAIADSRMKDGIKELKKIAGIKDEPVKVKKAKKRPTMQSSAQHSILKCLDNSSSQVTNLDIQTTTSPAKDKSQNPFVKRKSVAIKAEMV